jgi:hypothetical protein
MLLDVASVIKERYVVDEFYESARDGAFRGSWLAQEARKIAQIMIRRLRNR